MTDFNQCGIVLIKTRDNEIRLHTVYRSPNSVEENDEKLCKWIREMRGTNVLIGDFNLPDIAWEDGRARAKGRPFFEAISDQFIQQYVKEATHISGNT